MSREKTADYFLDITADVCPLTFVRTKLMVERMAVGETLEIRLKGREPLENLPKSLAELGHALLQVTPEEEGERHGAHRLLIRKG